MQMSCKKCGAYTSIVIGALLLLGASYANRKLERAQGYIDSATDYIPKGLGKDTANEKLHGKVHNYLTVVKIVYIGGGVLVLLGAAKLFFKRKESR